MKTLLMNKTAALLVLLAMTGSALAQNLVPLVLDLPAPAFKGTPKDMVVDPEVEPLTDTPRPPMMVPEGLQNVAKGRPVTSSIPTSGTTINKVVDGEKEPYDTSAYLMKKGTQWVQVDLGAPHEIYAVVIWHAHDVIKIYRDVIVQVSNDPEFQEGVHTIYNNDRDNSSGLGAGKDREYFESNEGRLIDAKGVVGRFVRSYTRGSTDSALNELVEIEVYGRPAK